MENVVQFSVDDTSPTIHYSPFPDTLTTPNLAAGWNPYYNLSGFAASIGEVGNGTSLHITSRDGASLAFQWRGSSIQLQGNVTLASYSITIDGQLIPIENQTEITNNILADIQGLEDADHNITLTAQIPPGQNPPNSSMLVFDKAVITSTPIPVSSNVSFRLDRLEDNDISFRGRWSFKNTSTGLSVHSSSTLGDRALTTFNGTTAFLLQGMTSPDAADYSVILDNVTTTYSARSSFTDYESLLFFASGLDPTASHSIEVRNLNGGDLSLLVGGFSTFVSYKSPTSSPTPIPSTPNTSTSTSGSTMSFAKGTIAAFILAGILAFLLITTVLLFFLWYRPRIRRRRRRGYQTRFAFVGGGGGGAGGGGGDATADATNGRFDQSPKAHEAAGVGVIDITPSRRGGRRVGGGGTGGGGGGGGGEPNYDKGPDLEDTRPNYDDEEDEEEEEEEDDGDRRHSQLSGFARWTREAVHGNFGGVSLPLHFRHSDSTGNGNGNGNNGNNGKNRTGAYAYRDSSIPVEERPRSEMSDLPPSTGSSARRKAAARTKSKGKARQITGRSWSPSFALDLPLHLPPHSHSHSQRKTPGPPRVSSARVTSVGEVSTFVAADPSPQDLRNPAPPSYAASVSVSNRDSNRDSNLSGSNSNPESSSFPSGPRSVSYSPVVADHPTSASAGALHHQHHHRRSHPHPHPHHRENTDGFLLHEGEPSSDQESPSTGNGKSNEYPHLQLTPSPPVPHPAPPPAEAYPLRQLTRYLDDNDGGNGNTSLTSPSPSQTEDNPSIVEPSAMRDVLRSLSPRTSEAPRFSRWLERDVEPGEGDNRTSLLVSPSVDSSSSSSSPPAPAPPPPEIQPTTSQSQNRLQAAAAAAAAAQIPVPKIKPLPRPPPPASKTSDELEDDVEVKDGVFLSVRTTSPFRVDFDSRSGLRDVTASAAGLGAGTGAGAGAASVSDDTTDGMYATASSSGSSSRKPSRQSSALRRLPEIPDMTHTTTAPTTGTTRTRTITRIPDFVQGTSRLPFRLTPITFPIDTLTPTPPPPKHPSSEGTSDGVTSFLDLSSSREGSLRSRSRSIRTGTAGSDQDRPVSMSMINEARLSVPGVMEPKSRWSNTTVPSIATNLVPPPSGESDSSSLSRDLLLTAAAAAADEPDARSRSTDSSTFPIAVQVNIPASPHHVMDFPFPSSSRVHGHDRRPETASASPTSGFTQAGDHLHVHPALENLDSPTESIPVSVSEVHFRHGSDSEEPVSPAAGPGAAAVASGTRQSSFHPSGHPPLPGSGSDPQYRDEEEGEYRPRPFDPSVLVSRVLGLSSPSTSANHSRSASTAPPPSTSTHAHAHTFPQRSNPSTSNDQLNKP